MKVTQNQRILTYLLLTQIGLCAMAPLDWNPPITRVAARIHNLKGQGWGIVTQQQCPRHDTPKNHAFYVLAGDRNMTGADR